MLKIRDVLEGQYEIKTRLGEGAMGAVYRAFDTELERDVAIKEFRMGYLPSEDDLSYNQDATLNKGKAPKSLTREAALKLFQKEAKLLANLNHSNLPTIFRYFVCGSEAYIVMFLVEGKSLADILVENGGPLPEEQVIDWLMQVLNALEYCHGKGVIHRDLKPNNILLNPDGKIFLIDFGIAKALNPGQHITSDGVVLLTPGYAPPEQYSLKGRTDLRSDLYSLGATAYSLLTGQIPTEATARMMGEPLPAPRGLNPTLSERIERFILKCLEIQKEDRPQSSKEASDLLIESVSNLPDHPTVKDLSLPGKHRDFFISYSKKDEAYVQRLVEGLEKRGCSCWVSYRDIAPAKIWSEQIIHGLKTTKRFILILTSSSNKSEHVEREVIMADELKLPLMCVKRKDIPLRDTISFYFAGKEHIPAYKHSSIEDTIMEIIKGVNENNPPPVPIPPPGPNLPWRKILAWVGGTTLLGLLVLFAFWKIIPSISETIKGIQATRTIVAATTQSAAATQTQVAWLTTLAATKSDTPTITPIPTKTYTPTFTLTSTFTPSPTSTLIPPDCTEIGQEWVSPVDGMILICVPAGSFTMGSDLFSKEESPAHNVRLDAFWIDQTEVTNVQYAECVADGDCSAPPSNNYDDPDFTNHPVVNVTWSDAKKYCTWAGRTLPTEAQWEKAARGSDGRTYPWGNQFACQKANGGDSSCDNTSGTTPIGIFLAGDSPYGVLDMAGNVWEWVADWYDEKYYQTFPVNQWPDNPTGPKTGDFRVLRGGSWNDINYFLRTSYRRLLYDSDRYNFVGFRCTRSQP